MSVLFVFIKTCGEFWPECRQSEVRIIIYVLKNDKNKEKKTWQEIE